MLPAAGTQYLQALAFSIARYGPAGSPLRHRRHNDSNLQKIDNNLRI